VENLIGPISSRKSTPSNGSALQLRSSGDMSPTSSAQLRRPSLGSNNSPCTTPRDGGSSPRAAPTSISPRAPESTSPRHSPLAASPLTAVSSPLAAFSSSPLASSCMLPSQGSTTTTPSTSTVAATSSPNPPSNAQEDDDDSESESDSSGEAAMLDLDGGEADRRRRSIPSTRATANEPAHVM
jgi:hypothetical protein